MKTKSVIAIALLGLLVTFQPSCQKDTEVVPVVIDFSDTLKAPSIPGAVNSISDAWTFDKVHSNINWETEYYAEHAWLTGKFNAFDVDIKFDQADYANTTINAWVKLSSFNTGEPGRDGPDKCGPKYLGVQFDTAMAPVPTTDSAWFSSTSSRIVDNYYVATGTFTFMGVTKTVDMYYTFTGITSITSSSGSVSNKAGFHGEFKFKALTDFGVTSTSIGDEIKVYVNANYNLPQ
jgi:polyisoprenoid-binding protein YceI